MEMLCLLSLLLKRGADPNEEGVVLGKAGITVWESMSPLEVAIRCFPVHRVGETVRILLEKGARWPQGVIYTIMIAKAIYSAVERGHCQVDIVVSAGVSAPVPRLIGVLSVVLQQEPELF
uniref:Uncharacterized protein n=1 Tax=Chromera velia CCMP2878 TaxID=1169474 RepID=A0A0G4IA59_9ALVE|eukprot:Cvel_12469.t1-p1 / transcript=Cvel_12469.t1 / gene=Cvel_12469 / organism=Chromera_velia_CCMP2878 / gene_product=hypothetical protein / transcript_product=hypothetical protein / location=Cvel_scaffold817:50796-51152(-) / protein_length=119 / sequence_SO=supercontig / SO=protein_coding / is_pseudo=false